MQYFKNTVNLFMQGCYMCGISVSFMHLISIQLDEIFLSKFPPPTFGTSGRFSLIVTGPLLILSQSMLYCEAGTW